MTSSTSPSPNFPACLADMSAATLFIGELMPHVNEVILYKKFAPMGTVTSVKLCRDWITGKSLCYAYVNFENPAEAEKAYRTLNYELLEGQPMRIMKSTRNPWLQTREEGCCYHHHHHHRCCSGGGGKELMDPQTLVDAIETYSKALKDVGEQHKGPTGYKYSKEFLKRMNIANTQFTNVFIKNFKDLLDDYKLYKLCKPFGEVTSAKVMVDEYGISKGFGFACFTDSDAAQRAVNKLNGLVLDGRTLYAGPALTKSERVKDWGGTRTDYDNHSNKQESAHVSFSPRICIRNLRDVVDEVRLRKEFERFGPVKQVELLTDNEGRSRGTGYVMYEDQADAVKAVNSMNGKMIYGTRIGVNYVPYTATAATNTYPDNFPSDQGDDDNISSRENYNGGKDSGDNNENSGDRNVYLHLKDLANTLGSRGHPVNIKDIDKHFNNNTNNTVNRNSSNNSEINTSNNAVKMASAASSLTPASAGEGAGCQGQVHSTETTTCSSSSINDDKGDVDTPEDEGNDSDCDGAKSGMATLLVKNLDESITDYKLESLFNVYGTVVSAKVVSSEFGVSKGFGFVIMVEAQDAVKAIKNLDGRIVVNRPIYISPTAQTRLSTN